MLLKEKKGNLVLVTNYQQEIINKYGFEEAKEKAEKQRKEWEKELEERLKQK